MITLNYRGFEARIEFEEGDRILVGRITGIDESAGFRGRSLEQAEKAFHRAIDDYLESRESAGC